MKVFSAVFLVLLLLPQADAQVRLEEVFSEVSFSRLTDFRHDSEGRIYIGEQPGRIRVFEDGVYVGYFLDITDRVGEASKEGGLQSFAFHPDYEETGYVFVTYVAVEPRRTVLSRFERSATDPLVLDPASEEVLLEVGQPEFNHNGGSIAFGPDGYLYVPLGDGGNVPAQAVNGQDTTTLLGSILRLDVDNPDEGLPYGIPVDNPFAGTGGPERAEIYAWGFRSPWRISFDVETGGFWLGDVGQNQYEEVDRVELGGNYGWAVMEGLHCYDPPTNCSMDGLELPAWEYDRSLGSSVTGGYVYRGADVPELAGQYIYGDFISGRIWALDIDAETGEATNVELLDTDLFITSFGEDAEGELYVLHYFGDVYRVVRNPVATEPGVPEATASLRLTGPNPFRTRTTLAFRSVAPGRARVVVYDVLGREVAVLYDGPVGREEIEVPFEAGALPAGVYLVRMTGAGSVRTQRLTLLR